MGNSRLPLVLIAEDDLQVRLLVRDAIGRFACVHAVEDGAEALKFLKNNQEPLSLVITDIMMPKVDGLTVLKAVRRDPRTKHVPVLVLTALGSPMDVVRGVNLGARHYMVKPFRKNKLVEMAQSLIAVYRREERARIEDSSARA